MIGIYISLSLLLLVVLILLIKIEVFFNYNDSVLLKLKILFFTVTLVPKKQKKKNKKKKQPKEKDKQPQKNKPEEKKAKKPSFIKNLHKKKGVSGIVELLTEIAHLFATTLSGLLSHLVISEFDVFISVKGEDAADTALKYGKTCTAVYPAVTVICTNSKCKDYNVSVTPAFDDDQIQMVQCNIRCYIRAVYIVKHLIIALIRLLVLRYKS